MKRCPRCRVELPLSEFGRNRARRDGRAAYCRSCARGYFREYSAQHREAINERNAAWRRANPEKMRAMRADWLARHPEYPTEKEHRRRARKYGAGMERIDRRAIYERDGGVCAFCGGVVPFAEMTLDHAIPIAHGGPHAVWNVRVAHRYCNTARGTKPFPMKLRFVTTEPVDIPDGVLPCVVIRGDWALVDIRRKR